MDNKVEKERDNFGVDINIDTISVSSKTLIENSEVHLYPGRKVALIGRNGSGKSTLLYIVNRIANDKELPEWVDFQGSVSLRPDSRISYLPQTIQVDFEGTVEEYLDDSAKDVAKTYGRYYGLIDQMAQKEISNEIINEYTFLIDEMNRLDAWDYLEKKKLVFEGLGFSEEYLKRDITEVSGGEASKIALGGVLLSGANVVLLDEPTNNLDPHNLEFLKDWFTNSQQTMLVVSHDRDFLDETIDEIIEIDEFRHRLNTYGGNYSFFMSMKRAEFEAQVRNYEEQQKKKKKLERDIKRLKKEAASFETTSTDSFYRTKGAKVAKRSVSQQKRIKRELTSITEPRPPQKPTIEVPETEPHKGLMISIDHLSFSFNSHKVIDDVSFNLKGGEKIVVIGPNGSGKTTLLKIIMGELIPDGGKVDIIGDPRIAYMSQYGDIENPSQSIVQYMKLRVNMSEDKIRTALGKVLFTDPEGLSAGSFSPGELKRIQFAAMFAQDPDVVILDEPTNYLDIYTIEMLEDAVRRYKGAVLVVTHDLAFIRNISPETIVVLNNGRVERVPMSKDIDPDEIFASRF